ncbi:MAG: MFS transporter [Chloroflexi bacterium]|uniref:MFS transporter n=1 Tax=Candidatus Chlorohelix allophototropha TaxID=3003348 RepID=A0A8T7M9J4_9CHLR|nr:MFS transporter [Chloroflexota bacterium]WJW68726.1 MFS transporter [Chloroflexota bacterium L227-S17]
MKLLPPTKQGYWTVWVANLSFFAAYYALLIPLPRYLTQIGLPDWQIGVILGAFGVAAVVGRPLAGILTDSWGYRQVLLLGAGSLMVGAAFVSLTTDPVLLFGLRLLQAFGYVAFTTAGTALISALALPGQQGAALALFGAAANVAMAFAPALINSLLDVLTVKGTFWLVAALALGGGALSLALHIEPQPTRPKRSWRVMLAIPRVLYWQMLVAWLVGLGFGAFLQFLPILTERRGLEPTGLAYAIYGVGIILTRLATGRLQDRGDRSRLLAFAFLLLAAALLGLAFVDLEGLLLANMLLMAAAMGILHPGVMANHVEMVSPNERWRGVVAFYLGYDTGIGMGSWLLGLALEWYGLTGMYLVAALGALLGLAITLRQHKG